MIKLSTIFSDRSFNSIRLVASDFYGTYPLRIAIGCRYPVEPVVQDLLFARSLPGAGSTSQSAGPRPERKSIRRDTSIFIFEQFHFELVFSSYYVSGLYIRLDKAI